MDFDNVTNLEEQFYNEGFKEGQEAAVKDSLKEGKEYGLQTAFQKFLFVGQVTALVDVIDQSFPAVDFGTHIEQLRELVSSIKLENDYNSVLAMDKAIAKIRNKVRIISAFVDRKISLQSLEGIGGVITGMDEENKKQVNLTDLGNEGVW